MYRSASAHFLLACCAVVALASEVIARQAADDLPALPPPVRNEEAASAMTDWLERHGLDELLAIHLEQQIDQTSGDQQRTIILRLAGIYSELLERTQDSDRITTYETRARRLLTMTEGDGAEELRLALLRTSYRVAERVVEMHRLRLASPEEVDRAMRALSEVVPKLQELNQQLDRSVQQLERQLSRATGAAAATASAQVAQMRALHHQSEFLTAWALYYDAWLNGNIQRARSAEEAFAKVLMTDSPRPQPQDTSVDLRATEPYARAILGMALSRSITSSSATALNWLELLRRDPTPAVIRNQAPSWTLVIRLEHNEFSDVQYLIREFGDERETLPLMWLRLIAVHALEAPEGTRGAPQMVQLAVSQLAALGEIDQIFDLAERYGRSALGESGFALRYVNGLIAYRDAREAHGEETPAVDQAHLDLYQQAVNHLVAAVRETDVEQYPAALGACWRLMGWARYFKGQFLEAHDAFVTAERHLTQNEASEALWMAIVCLDEQLRRARNRDVERARGALVEAFIDRYPESDRVPAIMLRLAISAERLEEDMLQQMLDVPVGNSVHESAMRRASQELYQRFRESTGQAKSEYAATFLEVAVPLIDASAPDEISRQRLLIDIRRMLDVALNPMVQRADLARRALQRYEQLVQMGFIADLALEQEFSYRKLQERLLDDDVPTASAHAADLWNINPQSAWSKMASRAMFQHAHALRPIDDIGRLHLIARYGGRVIREYEDEPRALENTQVLGYHATVAEAMMLLWEAEGDSTHARAALFLYQRMLTVAPQNATFLKAAAKLAVPMNELEFAANCWRRIAAGSQSGTEQWYEARFELMAVLEVLDPVHAREVVRQHVLLYPQYGPEPWGPRMYELARRLEEKEGDDS